MPNNNRGGIRHVTPDNHAEIVAALQRGGGGGTSDGMGPWETSVDKRLDQLHQDQRDLLRFAIGGFVLVFSALIVSFLLLSTKFEAGVERLAVKADALSAQVQDLKTDAAVRDARATTPTQLAPCPASKPDCKPWEREWESPPPVGTVVPK